MNITPNFADCPCCGWCGVKVKNDGTLYRHGRAQSTGQRYGAKVANAGCRGSGLPWNATQEQVAARNAK